MSYVPKSAITANSAATTMPTFIAHRGLGDNYGGYCNGPLGGIEETMYSIEAAFDCGAESVRLHAKQLNDGALAVMHDTTVNRTTTTTGAVSSFDLSSWRALTINTTQPGFNITIPDLLHPPTVREVLDRWGGKRHLQFSIGGDTWERVTGCANKMVALLKEKNLVNGEVLLSHDTTEISTLISDAGLDVMYFPPSFPNSGSNAATIAALNIWKTGRPKYVGLYDISTVTKTVTITNGSANVTAASGLTALNGWQIRGTGIPENTILTATSDTAGTLSKNATASGSNSMTIWPSDAVRTTYAQSLVTAGLRVFGWLTFTRWEKAFQQAAGVQHMSASESCYLSATSQIRTSTVDPTSLSRWPHGRLINLQYGRGSIANGGQTLDQNLGPSDQNYWNTLGDVSYLGTVPATYTFKTDFAFQTMPSNTSRWVGVAFGMADDRNFTVALEKRREYEFLSGYNVVVRANGQVQLFRNNGSTFAQAQLGSTQTMSVTPTAAAVFRLIIAVTASAITVSVKDTAETTTYATLTVSDSTYRGGFFAIGKAQAGTNVWSALFKNIWVG